MNRRAHIDRHRDWYLSVVREAAPSFFRGPESAPGSIGSTPNTTTCARPWRGASTSPAARNRPLELVAGLWRFWEIRGYLVEGRQWLDRVLATRPTDLVAARADALTGAGILAAARATTRPRCATTSRASPCTKSWATARQHPVRAQQPGQCRDSPRRLARARELYERVVAIMRPDTDPRTAFRAASTSPTSLDRQGDYEAARALRAGASRDQRRAATIWAAAYALGTYGQAAARHGDLELPGALSAGAVDLPTDGRSSAARPGS